MRTRDSARTFPVRPVPLLAGVVLAILLASTTLSGWACQVPRVDRAEADRIAELLGVAPGMILADVGAGDGRWTLDLSRRVGDDGRVFATEVDPSDLEEIEANVEEAGAANVTVVEGSQGSTELPAACCEAILLRRVYHHFTDPAAMNASLRESLEPGGLLLVIDFDPGGNSMSPPSGVPDNRGGHGVSRELLLEEMRAAGLEVLEQHRGWMGDEDDFAVLFRRPEPMAP